MTAEEQRTGPHPNEPVDDRPTDWQLTPDVRAVQKRTVPRLILAQVFGSVGVGAVISVGAILASQVAGRESLAGVARTATSVGAALLAIPMAWAAQRYGRGKALGTGWLLAALGAVLSMLSAITSSFIMLVIGMLLFGSGQAANLQTRFAASDLAAPSHRSRTLSIVIWSTTIGSVVGPNLGAPGKIVAGWLSMPRLAGPFLIASVVTLIASAIMWVLRPDPLLLARQHLPDDERHDSTDKQRVTMAQLFDGRTAKVALLTLVTGHTVMAAVMTMTPVQMNDHGAGLDVIGLTISVHVIGMYAFSPLSGWLSDRWGRIQTILAGQMVFLAGCGTAGFGRNNMSWITVGLFLIGLGWSFSIVAGSALLSESVIPKLRTVAQGRSDMLMNLTAAVAAGASGPLQAVAGFGFLNVVGAVLVIPVIVLALTQSKTARAT